MFGKNAHSEKYCDCHEKTYFLCGNNGIIFPIGVSDAHKYIAYVRM